MQSLERQICSLFLFSKSERYQNYAHLFNLAYYLCLSVYAVINFSFLLYAIIGLPFSSSIILACFAICFAMLNEFINLKIVSNPARQASLRQKATLDHGLILCGVTSLLLSCIDNLLSNCNMLLIQQMTLAQRGMVLPAIFTFIYHYGLIGCGLIAFAMTAATNWLCYVCPDISNKQFVSKTDAQIHKKQVSSFDAFLLSMLKQPVITWTGTFIGAVLYAYGDYQQYAGIFMILAQQGILLPPALISMTLSTVSLTTFFDRVMIWSNNARLFMLSLNSRSACGDAKNKHEQQLIRKHLSHARLFFQISRAWLLSLLSFKGNYRAFSLFTSSAAAATSFVQNSFLIAEETDQIDNSASVTANRIGSSRLVPGRA